MTLPIVQAWVSAGCPSAENDPSIETTCGLCGTDGPGHPFKEAISDNFTAWEQLPFQADSKGFCTACVWGFKTKDLRLRIHQLTPEFRELSPSMLRELLSEALDYRVTIAVPIGRQKHVAPWAREGMIRTDNEDVAWTADDARRLDAVARLRTLGFGEQALTEHEPRWLLLKKLNNEERKEVMALWPMLKVWRSHPVMMEIAARATRIEK